MIYVNLVGGLGNQMFQYAYATYLGSISNKKIKLVTDFYELYNNHNGFELSDVFNIDCERASIDELHNEFGLFSYKFSRIILSKYSPPFSINNMYFEHSVENILDLDLSGRSYYIHGYWQNYIYLNFIKHTILEKFIFKKNIIDGIRPNLINEVVTSNSVSIHIRRGDYSKKSNINLFYKCDMKYFHSAIRYIMKNIYDPVFYFFSDDITWVENQFSWLKNSVFVSRDLVNQSAQEMYIMSLCKNNIISNSTFGWWPAWLNRNNNKVVVSPNKWFNKNDIINQIIPDDWIRI